MRINIEPNDEKIVNCDQRAQVKHIAGKMTPEEAADRITACCEKVQWIDASVNEKLIFEELLLNLDGSAIL